MKQVYSHALRMESSSKFGKQFKTRRLLEPPAPRRRVYGVKTRAVLNNEKVCKPAPLLYETQNTKHKTLAIWARSAIRQNSTVDGLRPLRPCHPSTISSKGVCYETVIYPLRFVQSLSHIV